MLIFEFLFAFFLSLLIFLANFLEEGCYGLGLDGAIATKEPEAWLLINFDVGDSGPVLPSIVLLFHQNIHLVHGVGGAIFFDVVGKWLAKSNEGYAAFVKDRFTHRFLFQSLRKSNDQKLAFLLLKAQRP
jgi:hypothetical protein